MAQANAAPGKTQSVFFLTGTKYDPFNEQTFAPLHAIGPYEFDFSLEFVAT